MKSCNQDFDFYDLHTINQHVNCCSLLFCVQLTSSKQFLIRCWIINTTIVLVNGDTTVSVFCSRKAIGPSNIANDFAKCLMICSKSSDILSDHLKTFSWKSKLKCHEFFEMLEIISHIIWWSKKYFREHCSISSILVISQYTTETSMCIPLTYLSSYLGYFQEPNWKSMGLLEISMLTQQLCSHPIAHIYLGQCIHIFQSLKSFIT